MSIFIFISNLSFIGFFKFLIEFKFTFILILGIFLLTIILLLASRSTDKILKGLQGTASATVIARGAIDAYKAWESSNPDDENKSDENKKNDKKDEIKEGDNKNEVKDNNPDKNNEK